MQLEKKMTIIVLGHGGGVPMQPYGVAGNTNYALVPGPLDGEHQTVEEILATRPYWLVDCGPETLMRISGTSQAPEPMVQNLIGVILTHCHGDHSGGLPALCWRSKFVEQKKLKLVFREELRPFLAAQLIETQFMCERQFVWTEHWETYAYSATRMRMDLDSGNGNYFSIRLFEVDHNIPKFPSFGVDVIVQDGRALISGDTAFPLKEDLHRVKAVFHDVQFYSEDMTTAVHCPYKHLEAAVPRESRSKVYLAHTNQKPPAEALEAGFLWACMDTVVEV